MSETKRIIWNDEVDVSKDGIAAWREDNRETDESVDSMSENEIIDAIYSDSERWLDDEDGNLNKELPFSVIAIADLGFWNGRCQGYKILPANLNSFLGTHQSQNDYNGVEYWSDDHDIRGKAPHHDATHYFVFRQLKGTEEECSDLLDAIYDGKDYTALLDQYTTSLAPLVAEVYGWPALG